LYRLEKYNGFGYRKRGLATPYLWSFSDRYRQGKYVADGVFDPAAVSGQCGAAVIMKRLIDLGEIEFPS
jgi:lysozyme family protein